VSEVTVSADPDQATVLVRAEPDGAYNSELGVAPGRAIRGGDGVLVARPAPDAWMLLAPPGALAPVRTRMEALVQGRFASVVDVSHGYSLARLTGSGAASVLAQMCSIDMSDRVMPDGTVVRTLVAGIVATVIRDDAGAARSSVAQPAPSYLVQCDRSYGRYLMDVLVDAAHPR
jgi:heterotetrameric sarcosine oxidase gamma subunit